MLFALGKAAMKHSKNPDSIGDGDTFDAKYAYLEKSDGEYDKEDE